jgi:hypothetical protein
MFGRIDNVYHGHPLHDLPAMGFLDVCAPFARTTIAWMRGDATDGALGALFQAMALASEVIKARAPDSYIRITALAALIRGDRDQTRWAGLAAQSSAVLTWADQSGLYQPFDHVLDAPFYILDTTSAETLETALDRIEAYRLANIGYWLTISPPLIDETDAGWRKEEGDLLRELRAARFIRLIPNLPAHYRRYGIDLNDLRAAPPRGAKILPQDRNPLGYDPFDQQQAQNELWGARQRLMQFYEKLISIEPDYASAGIKPRSSASEFAAALSAHRSP